MGKGHGWVRERSGDAVWVGKISVSNAADMWKSVLGRRSSKCKCPETGMPDTPKEQGDPYGWSE